MTLRRDLYRAARALGWAQAARKGRLPQRTYNVFIGRQSAKIMRRLWK